MARSASLRIRVAKHPGVFHHAAGRDHLSQDLARPDLDRLPADLRGPFRYCPRRDHGIDRAGSAEAFKSGPGSNVSRGMFLILSYTANIFDKMIIAGAGSITARGLIEKTGGVEVLWSQWFLAFLPCSIITVVVAWRLTLWLYPPETVRLEGGHDYLRSELARMGPLTPQE